MAITVIGGLTLSTALTLIFIPIVYEAVSGRRRAIAAPVAQPPLHVSPLEMPNGGD
jgi:hypothetical protein